MTIIFKICKWLDRDEYLKIMEFAEYLGRKSGCSIFSLKYSAMHSSRLEEHIEYLESIGAEISEEDRRKIENIIKEYTTVRIEKTEEGFIVYSKARLAPLLEEFRAKGLAYYSRIKQGFIIKPYAIVDVVSSFSRNGFTVVDDTCLIMCRKTTSIQFYGKLRDYQKEALESWSKNSFRGIIALPTGSGKTIIALAAMAQLGVPTLIVVYTREQLLEWFNKLLKFTSLRQSDIGKLYSEEKSIREVTIATYQSAYRNIEHLRDKFSLLIVDEAHHLPADKFRYIALRALAPYRLGLSATPYREDGRHEELFALMGGVVYEKSVQELEARGYVASFIVIPRIIALQPEENRKYRELRRAYQALARGRKVEELVRAVRVGDESARKALQLLHKIRMLLALSKSKIEETRRIVEEELSRDSKIIIFTQYVKQAETLGKILGIPVVTGKTEPRKRKILMELFKSGRYRAIVLTTVGDEGIDIPDADVGIILSGTSSRRQFIQRLGRLLRPGRDGKQKIARLYYVATKGTQEEATLKKLLHALHY